MEKNKVLIIAHHLTFGGSQMSMLSTLPLIDFKKNDVTLYIRKNRLDLIDLVDQRVKVIINNDETHYYRKFKVVLFLLLKKFFHMLRLKNLEKKYINEYSEYVREQMCLHEFNHYFKNEHYDVAVSFFQGYTIDILVNKINADKKYIFYRSSIDENHDFHDKAFEKLDGIIVTSNDLKEIISKFYIKHKEKICVIENYIDATEIIKKSNAYSISDEKSSIVLCSCGRLTQEKGFEIAVEAAVILKKKGIDFKWYFVGDGTNREKIETMIENNNLKTNVVVTGMKDNPFPWVKYCDIYVQPSKEESYGRTIKEAVVLGKPIVSTETIGAKSIFASKCYGILTQINAEGIAEGVIEMLSDSEFKERCMKAYTLEENLRERQKYIEMINKLVLGEI